MVINYAFLGIKQSHVFSFYIPMYEKALVCSPNFRRQKKSGKYKIMPRDLEGAVFCYNNNKFYLYSAIYPEKIID